VLRLREENGFAMVTALLVSMAVLSLSVVVLNLSIHNSQTSSFDRDRVGAIDAAEAGISSYVAALKSSTGAATCNPIDGDLTVSPVTHYHVTIQLYSTWPPSVGSELSCPPPTGVDPLGALVTSKGTINAAGGLATRTMETAVSLAPIYGGLGQAIFSNIQLNLLNKLTLNGNISNDGDVYTNGSFTLANNTTISGSVYAQGSVDVNQGTVKQDVWGNTSVALHNISVLGKATSSTSFITLDTATVYGDAKAGTTITVSGNSAVKGTQTSNSPSGPPPQLTFPQITYDSSKWIAAGYTINTFATCIAAQAFINLAPSGNNVVRVTPTCALSWGNNSTVTLNGNLAIFTDGSFTTQNQTTWNGSGGTRLLYVVRPYQSGLACTPPTPSSYDVTVSNNTSFNSINLLVYSQCTVNFGNNNANGVNGQIIGGQVNITNQMVLNYRPLIVPGFNVTGYTPSIAYEREIPS
jgi:hypothetical protein